MAAPMTKEDMTIDVKTEWGEIQEEAELPFDLGADAAKETEKKSVAPDEYLNAMEDAIGETIDMENLNLEEMAKRAAEYSKRVEEATDKKAPKAPPNAPELPKERTPLPTAAPAQKKEEPAPTRGRGRGRGGRGGNLSRAAHRTLALAGGKAAKDPPIRPTPEKQPPVAKEEKGATENPPPPEASKQEGVPLTPDTPALGDEEFPVIRPPSPSAEYDTLSLVSTQRESFQSEIGALAEQVRNLARETANVNLKMATFQADIAGIKQDKSSFMSDVLDRIRALERSLGNAPSQTTLASSVSVSQDPDKTPKRQDEEKETKKPMSKEEFMARLKQHKAMRSAQE